MGLSQQTVCERADRAPRFETPIGNFVPWSIFDEMECDGRGFEHRLLDV